MAAGINVAKMSETEFRVSVAEDGRQTEHRVTLSRADYERLTDEKTSPEDLIKRSFEFLLENESKESILARFDLPVIGRYFPNYEKEIRRRISEKH